MEDESGQQEIQGKIAGLTKKNGLLMISVYKESLHLGKVTLIHLLCQV